VAAKSASRIELTGFLGSFAELSFQNRVKKFITGSSSEPVQIWAPEFVKDQTGGDWYGEHVGKWLVTACNWLEVRKDDDLESTVRAVADYVLSQQTTDGSWSCYAPGAESRFNHPNADQVRTWDLWILANLILGLQRASLVLSEPRYLQAIDRLVDLMAATFVGTERRITNQGNHQGLSSAVLLEPIARQWLITRQPAARAMVDKLVDELTDGKGLALIPRLLHGDDVSQIGTGKIYQMLWVGVGLVVASDVTGNPKLLDAAIAMWDRTKEHHLTPQGGPWGGIATHKEVFNPAGYFDPGGFVETCSVMVWNQLSRELYERFGVGQYLDEIERSTYNQLVGAQDANGEDWCYFSFPNGQRHNTYYWACCKSSGPLALSDAVKFAGQVSVDEVRLNYIESGSFDLAVESGRIVLDCQAEFGQIARLSCVIADSPSNAWTLALREPSWSGGTVVTVNGESVTATKTADGYLRFSRHWLVGDEIAVSHLCRAVVKPAFQTADHHGQEVVRNDFFHVSFGPFSMATGLIDGYRRFETLRLAQLNGETMFKFRDGEKLPILELVRTGGAPIRFVPYAVAGGMHDEAWRLTWMGVAWQ